MMKRYITILLACLSTLGIMAQSHIRLWQKGEDNRMSIAKLGAMSFAGQQVTIKGTTYNLSDIDSIEVVPEVTVHYDGNVAKVNIPAAVQKEVTATVQGANVVLTNKNVTNEIEVVMSGTSTNGSLTYNGSYKVSFILNALNLRSAKGNPLNIQCGKRISLELMEGTDNSLVDATSGTHKGTLYCKGHLEIKGAGNLTVTGNVKHAISTKEYLELKRSTGNITIAKAAGDAIHVGQYFLMSGGNVSFTETTMGDGIQVEYILADDGVSIDASKEDNGKMFIQGGIVTGITSHEDCEAIKCDGDILLSGGTLQLTASGNGSRGIHTDGNLTLSESNPKQPLKIAITASGGRCMNTEHQADPHRCTGIKVDGNLTVTGGTTAVDVTNKSARGIQFRGQFSQTGGTLTPDPIYVSKN